MNKKDFVLAIILTILTISLAYFLAKDIERIEKEKIEKINQTLKRNLTPKNYSESLANITENKKESLENNKSFSNISIPNINIPTSSEKIQKEEIIKTVNYSKFEEAYVYDICYASEVFSIEGRNLICLNEIPKKISIKFENGKTVISYNDKLLREESLNEEILLAYAYAKDFYGVEGEIKNVFTNSSFAYIPSYSFGEINYYNQTIVYISFPIFVKTQEIKNETLYIFVETSIKNYLISSIEIIRY